MSDSQEPDCSWSSLERLRPQIPLLDNMAEAGITEAAIAPWLADMSILSMRISGVTISRDTTPQRQVDIEPVNEAPRHWLDEECDQRGEAYSEHGDHDASNEHESPRSTQEHLSIRRVSVNEWLEGVDEFVDSMVALSEDERPVWTPELWAHLMPGEVDVLGYDDWTGFLDHLDRMPRMIHRVRGDFQQCPYPDLRYIGIRQQRERRALGELSSNVPWAPYVFDEPSDEIDNIENWDPTWMDLEEGSVGDDDEEGDDDIWTRAHASAMEAEAAAARATRERTLMMEAERRIQSRIPGVGDELSPGRRVVCIR